MSNRATHRIRRGLVGLALGCIACAPLVPMQRSAQATPRHEPVTTITLCGQSDRLTAADVTVDGPRARIQTVCVRDSPPGAATRTQSFRLNFTAGAAALQSVYAGATAATLSTSVAITSAGQIATIRWRDGKPCATVTAVERAARPVPSRFLAESGDWRSAVDYLVDPGCRVLAVRLGNRLAVLPAGRPEHFDLYGVNFSVR